MKSLDCLRPMGTMVSFGQSGGTVPPFDLGMLSAKGSLFLTRPSLMTYTARREDLLAHAKDLFEVVEKRDRKGADREDLLPGRRGHGPSRHRIPAHYRLLDSHSMTGFVPL